jgi:hypothetical protein
MTQQCENHRSNSNSLQISVAVYSSIYGFTHSTNFDVTEVAEGGNGGRWFGIVVLGKRPVEAGRATSCGKLNSIVDEGLCTRGAEVI